MPTNTAIQMRALNEAHEELGRSIPLANEYLEIRDKVFAIADDLGIGEEFRTLYHDAALGSKVGAAAGAGAAAVLGGGALAAAYSGAAASGMAVGMAAGGLVGAAIAVAGGFISGLFGGDDDEEAKKAAAKKKKAAADAARERAREDWVRWVLTPLTFGNLVSNQQKFAGELHQFAQAKPMADKLVTLYQRTRVALNPWQREVFLIDADRGRLIDQLATSPWISIKGSWSDTMRSRIESRLRELETRSLLLARDRAKSARRGGESRAGKSGGSLLIALGLGWLFLRRR